jgi:hypothetical protein
MLRSPFSQTVKDGYDMLFQLLKDNENNSNFIEDLEQLTREYPMLSQELEVRRQSTEIKAVPVDFVELNEGKDSIEMTDSHAKKVFISYSHRDEKFKDELITILIPLQDQGILTIWHDREITPGTDWYQAIQDAMNDCDLALLLVSGDFLASRFIRDKELARLFQRRKEEGLRVVPIIIRSCKWQSIPVLRDIQALPKNAKPLISFRDTGKRDEIWTEIATAIEDLC